MKPGAENLNIVDWGLLDYEQAFDRQSKLLAERLSGQTTDSVILVEHPPVRTLGRRGTNADLRISEEVLQNSGIALHRTDRGGQATAHEPGQLVAYPIIELREKDLHLYVQRLLETVAAVLQQYGLEPTFKKGEPGLWVDEKKIASLGVAVKRWVTSHGVALNVNNSLQVFDSIVPCGHPDQKLTSMEKELGRSLPLAEVQEVFVTKFREIFGYVDRQPNWLKLPSPKMSAIIQMEKLLGDRRLATVCQSAQCPNLGECFSRGTATFMILGSVCTRQCRFCAVDKGCPVPVDPQEPERVGQAAKKLGLKYVVVTSVTRDDLTDGGAGHFAKTIEAIRQELPSTNIEVLVPDFQGDRESLTTVFRARPEMFNHNIETVPRLYDHVRSQAHYHRSLLVLRAAADFGLAVKSGLMLGLGERPEEIEKDAGRA